MVESNNTNQRKILVVGPTGNIGSALIPNLMDSGANVRALVRDKTKAQPLADIGVEVVLGDLEKPETLDNAFHGVDKVFLITAPGPNQVIQASNAIAAAKRQGDPHIVRLSAMLVAPDSPARIGRQHGQIETVLRESGLHYTTIRPHFFMQNTLMAASSVAAEGAIYMPLKSGKIGMIDVRDIVDAAAKILMGDHHGKTYILTGPASISFDEVAAALSRALSTEVRYINVKLDVARESMVGMGLSEWFADALNEYSLAFSQGDGDLATDDVEQLTGKPARSYDAFARDYAEVFKGARKVA